MTTDIVTEERVSFETAKLLDEKRWAIACHAAYFLTDLAQMTSAAVLMKKQMIGQLITHMRKQKIEQLIIV